MPINVYEMYPLPNFRPLYVLDGDDVKKMWHDGTSRKDDWVPIPVEYGSTRHGQRTDWDIDCGLGPLFFLTRRGADILSPLLEPYGEFLPLVSADGEFYAYNSTYIIDALDHGTSDFTRFPSSGRISGWNHLAFKEEIIEDVPLFLVPEFPRGRLFLTVHFVECYAKNDLRGVKFKPIQ
jgi:hypothetical protein